VICEGLVKLTYVAEEGRSCLLRLLRPGDLLGKGALIRSVYRAYAQTLQPSRLLIIKPRELGRLLSSSEELALGLIRSFAEEAYEFQVRLLAANQGSLQEELAVLLWFLQRRFGRRTPEGIWLEPRLPCQMLAEMLYRSRQRVSEALGVLKQKGLVEAHYGNIVIKDIEGLKGLCKPFLSAGGGDRSVASVTDFLLHM